MGKSWEDKKTSFPVIDVRNLTGNFLIMILNKAQQVNLNNGICVAQSFEPKPLYSALEDLGFEYVATRKCPSLRLIHFLEVPQGGIFIHLCKNNTCRIVP